MLPKYAIKWGAVWRRNPLKYRDFHREYGVRTDFYGIQTPTFVAYEPRLLCAYVIWTVFIGGEGGLQFVEKVSEFRKSTLQEEGPDLSTEGHASRSWVSIAKSQGMAPLCLEEPGAAPRLPWLSADRSWVFGPKDSWAPDLMLSRIWDSLRAAHLLGRPCLPWWAFRPRRKKK